MANGALTRFATRSRYFLTRRKLFSAASVLLTFGVFYLLYLSLELPVVERVLARPRTCVGATLGHQRATLLMFTGDSELLHILGAMRSVEDRFNKQHHYPWTFVSEKKFSRDFKKYTAGLASGPIEYAVIPKDHWEVPEDIDKLRMQRQMKELAENGVPFGDSLPYRQTCRFQSGFFFDQEVMQKYDWYWRIEPNTKLSCDVTQDPFLFMEETNKTYGFSITMKEFESTIPSLWDRTKEYFNENPHVVSPGNSLDWVIQEPDASATAGHGVPPMSLYNRCHFWSNFEIASLAFFRSKEYRDYFESLDRSGGFFLERWGDAIVHSMALAAMLPKKKIHHFSDIGYQHGDIQRCPAEEESHSSGRCWCDRRSSYDTHRDSCTREWYDLLKANGDG